MANQIALGAVFDARASRRLIESYTPSADDVVAPYYQRQFLDLIDSAPAHFANRYNYDIGLQGHITSQAVIYNPSLNAVTMIHHKKLNIWVGLGGHAEPGDTDFIATARREAAEEGGFHDLTLAQESPFDLDIHGFPAKKDQPDHLHYDLRFLFTTNQMDLHPNEESLDIQWVKIAELPQFLPNILSNNRLIRGLQTRFAP